MTELLIKKVSLIALICMMIDVLSEKANIYLQQYMPGWCVGVAEEDRDVLLETQPPSDNLSLTRGFAFCVTSAADNQLSPQIDLV